MSGAVGKIEAGQGDPVVLLHGVGLQSEVWRAQIDELSASHHVVAFDLPGHGNSAQLPLEAGLDDFVATISGWIRAAGLSGVTVIGHSLGALIAVGLAARHPGLVSRAALLSPVFQRTPDAQHAVLARANELSGGAAQLNAPLDCWFSKGGDPEIISQLQGYLWEVDQIGYATAYHAFASVNDAYELRYTEITCPVLVMTGRDDTNSRADMAEALGAVIPDARVEIIENHHHMIGLTAAEEVNAILFEWMAQTKHVTARAAAAKPQSENAPR